MQLPEDSDPIETREWLDSLTSVVHLAGRDRGVHLLGALSRHAQDLGLTAPPPSYSAYRNTISIAEQATHPGNVALEGRLTALMRWIALAIVSRAYRAYG